MPNQPVEIHPDQMLIDDLFADDAPALAASPTSVAAADSVQAELPRLEGVVLDWLRANGPATDEQIIVGTGLAQNTARPRRVSLVKKGLVVADGQGKTASGRSAVRWRAAD